TGSTGRTGLTMSTMRAEPLTVRGVDDTVWHAARVYAVENDLTMGQVVTHALVTILKASGMSEGTRDRKQGAKPSARLRSLRQSSPSAQATASNEQLPAIDQASARGAVQPPRAARDLKPCSHGLLLHPGCSDGH